LGKRTVIVLVVVATLVVISAVIFLSTGSVRIGDVFDTISHLNPRVVGFLALPFIAVAVVIGLYAYKKREERMWKNALLKPRATRQLSKQLKKSDTSNLH